MARESKKLSNADIRKMVQSKILEALESGVNPWRKPWTPQSTAGGIMPHNCISGHEYRGVNVPFLMACQSLGGFPSAQWLTFNQARKAGGTVRKGEKASWVIFTKPLRFTEKDKTTGEEFTKQVFMLRLTPVFNIAQCDDVKLPKREQPVEVPEALPPTALVLKVQSFMESVGASVSYGGHQAFYRPSTDSITLPPVDTFHTPEGFAATALHELVHWTGHGSRLARVGIVKGGFFGSEDYAFEELVAELGSTMLGYHFGVSNEVENHASYIGGWIKAIKEDDKAIFRASKLAECAAEYLVPTEEIEEAEELKEAA